MNTDLFQEKANENARLIGASGHFLSLVTPGYDKDWLWTMQMGMAIALDKPIYLIVNKKVSISERMKSIAEHIEYFDCEGDLERAVSVITERIKSCTNTQETPI